METLLIIIGGALVVLVPLLWLVELGKTRESQRAYRAFISLFGVVCFVAAVTLAGRGAISLLGAVLAAVGFAGWRAWRKARRPEPDFVVEGRLLGDAISPELAAELAVLEQRGRNGDSVSEIEPALRRPEPAERRGRASSIGNHHFIADQFRRQ